MYHLLISQLCFQIRSHHMKILIISAFLVAGTIANTEELIYRPDNATRHEVHLRNKRFLVYPNGGTLKFSTGVVGPVDIPKFQNLNCWRNFQYQYNLPHNWITNPPSFPGLTRSEGRGFSSSENLKPMPDSSRKVAYQVVENILEREGKNGHECLLRAICEVAETPLKYNGLIGELLQLFLTPGQHEKIHKDYHDARKVGLNNVDCEKMYPDCPFGHGVLDSFSLIKDFKFQSWLSF